MAFKNSLSDEQVLEFREAFDIFDRGKFSYWSLIGLHILNLNYILRW